MRQRRFLTLPLVGCALLLSMGACVEDWGQSDPPAGGSTTFADASFVTAFEDPETDLPYSLVKNSEGELPEVVTPEDPDGFYGKVLHLNGGAMTLDNPLKGLIKGHFAVSFYVMETPQFSYEEDGVTIKEQLPSSSNSNLFSAFANEYSRFVLTGNGTASLVSATGDRLYNLDERPTGATEPTGVWHWVVAEFNTTGYAVYVNGYKRVSGNGTLADYAGFLETINGASTFQFGDEIDGVDWYIDNITVYNYALDDKIRKDPRVKSGGEEEVEYFSPIYFNNFEAGVGDCQIVGGGSIIVDPQFGKVFSNAMNGMRQNYLLLPEDALSHATSTEETTISVWVNRGNEKESGHYMWSPLFMAYGGAPAADGTNGMPMFACQYRGVLQINNNGWSDFTDSQNDNGPNILYHNDNDWLKDGKWHLYTATFTKTKAAVYFDGELANSWTLTGSGDGNVLTGLFADGDKLKYICLGGNQAWNWGDPDPGFWFDDIAIYDRAISQEQIKSIVKAKNEAVYSNNFEQGVGDCTIVGGGSIIEDPVFGKVFSNAMNGMRQNYLLLPEDALSHASSTEETTIALWVNRGNEKESGHYMWSPLFMAYGGAPADGTNGTPMFACQYRGVLQINNNGWSDFTDAQNDNGPNIVYHADNDWLKDGKWHLYTATFTKTTAAVYFDGELANSWTLTGSGDGNVLTGLFADGDKLKYICLGGNQAWNWGDPDPGFWFDNIRIYNVALTQDEIKHILLNNK